MFEQDGSEVAGQLEFFPEPAGCVFESGHVCPSPFAAGAGSLGLIIPYGRLGGRGRKGQASPRTTNRPGNIDSATTDALGTRQ